VRHAVRDLDATGVVGDLANLPIASGWADLVLAMHMLYNLADIDGALAEIRRVLRPDGQLLVATSAPDTLSELHQLFDESVRALHPGPWRNRAAPHLHRFDLSNGGARLSRVFRSVQRRTHDVPLAIEGAEPAAAYVDSTRPWRESHLPPGVRWEAVMSQVRSRASEAVNRDGSFRVTLREGLFVCR
jgi:SAM-dependent methyltransferase